MVGCCCFCFWPGSLLWCACVRLQPSSRVFFPPQCMSRSEQLRQLAVQLASLASLEDVVTHGLQSLLESSSRLVAPAFAATLPFAFRGHAPVRVLPYPRLHRIAAARSASPVRASWQQRTALQPRPSVPAPPVTAPALRPALLVSRRLRAPPARRATPHYPRLAPRLSTHARLPPVWLVGDLLAPLRLGGAAATSDGGAHAGTRNRLCGARFGLKIAAASPCGRVARTPRPTMTTTTPATPFCSCRACAVQHVGDRRAGGSHNTYIVQKKEEPQHHTYTHQVEEPQQQDQQHTHQRTRTTKTHTHLKEEEAEQHQPEEEEGVLCVLLLFFFFFGCVLLF